MDFGKDTGLDPNRLFDNFEEKKKQEKAAKLKSLVDQGYPKSIYKRLLEEAER